MSKNIIDNTAVFTCSEGIGVTYAPVSNQEIAKGEGKPFLNMNTKCMIKGIGQCKMQPNPSGGYLPCSQLVMPVTSWSGEDKVITIDGAKGLTNEVKTMCPLGGKIALQSECNTLFKAECELDVSEIEIACDQSHINKCNFENNIDNTKNSNVITNEQVEYQQKRNDVDNEKYALCPYEKCEEREGCSYYCAKPIVENDSAKLRRRYEKDKSVEYNEYIEKHKKLCEINSKIGWGYAAHHIIPGNQVLMSKEKHKDILRYGHLLKLLYMSGYDVNNAYNCILLPTKAGEEGSWGCAEKYEKAAKAFEVMDIIKKQWHLGKHSYKIPENSLKYYRPTDEQLLEANISVYFADYVSVVHSKMDSLNAKYSRSLCWRDAGINEELIKDINNISEEINKKLSFFEKDPKKSYPYYVSAASVYYAYDAPITGKMIILFKKNNMIYASKFRVSRKKQENDNYIILVVQNYEQPIIKITKETMHDFVRYCENIMHFWIDKSIGKELPWELSNEKIAIREIGDININDYAINSSKEMFAFIDERENNNSGAVAQINKRWREAKENVDFYD